MHRLGKRSDDRVPVQTSQTRAALRVDAAHINEDLVVPWVCLKDIAIREGVSRQTIVRRIEKEKKKDGASFSSPIRVYIVLCYRDLAVSSDKGIGTGSS
jgi:Ribbon-helix-helix domain